MYGKEEKNFSWKTYVKSAGDVKYFVIYFYTIEREIIGELIVIEAYRCLKFTASAELN